MAPVTRSKGRTEGDEHPHSRNPTVGKRDREDINRIRVIAVSPSTLMASTNPKPSESRSDEKRNRSHIHQQQHRQIEEYPVTKMSKPSSGRWAGLPQEIVETIIGLLTLPDYFPFGLVCKPWRSAAVNARRLLKPPPLLILKPGNRAVEAEATGFYAVFGGGEHRKLPMLGIGHGARCCGSSLGWLLMVDNADASRMHLLDPISRERVELPAFPTLSTLERHDGVLCSAPPSDPGCIVALRGTMTHDEPYKATYHLPVLLTCRPKDNQWRLIHYNDRMYTFALYEGRLYVIHNLRMDTYDFDPGPRKVRSVVLDDVLRMRDVWDWKRLAVMDGKLLLVCSPVGQPRRVYQFVDHRWLAIQSLGEWVLMIDVFSSQAFSTKESPMLGFRANCIYQPALDSLLVYSMEDESVVTVSLPRPQTQPSFAGGRIKFFWFLPRSW